MKTFQYDPNKIHYPQIDGRYVKLGSWSFDPDDDECDLAYAEDAIYAWIAWYEFVANRKGTK